MALNRKLRMGMVGGGRGAFIGAVHRMAANLDGKIELVAGAFSSDPEKSRLSGEDFFLSPDRVYGCLLYTSPSPRDRTRSRMPSSA